MATGGENLCVCGCGDTTDSTFTSGHDPKLVLKIARNDPEELAGVDWFRLDREKPDFYKGQLREQVEWHLRYQRQLEEGKSRYGE